MPIPVHSSHSVATCFRCTGCLLDDPMPTGFAFGKGQWSAVCVECNKLSFYDLRPEPIAQDNKPEQITYLEAA